MPQLGWDHGTGVLLAYNICLTAGIILSWQRDQGRRANFGMHHEKGQLTYRFR